MGNRIFLPDPKQTAFVLYTMLVLLILLSIRRAKKNQCFLDFWQTQQLKGFAILLVIIGHLDAHTIVRTKFIPFLGPYGIALFLFLSGYGLIRSHHRNKLTFLQFTRRRINRVFVPYWITTALFLSLNYFLLAEKYSLLLIALTTLGLNFDRTTQLLDYVRWFIPFIVFFYIVFFIATRFKRLTSQILILTLVPVAACLVNFFFNVLPQKGYNPWNQYILLFPAGFFVGIYREKLRGFFSVSGRFHNRGLILAFLFWIAYFLLRYLQGIRLSDNVIYTSIIANVSYIAFVLFMVSICIFCSALNLHSRLLYVMGLLSYEIYLLHCAFMVKYDFILFRFPVQYSFFIYITAILFLAYALQKLSALIASGKSAFLSAK